MSLFESNPNVLTYVGAVNSYSVPVKCCDVVNTESFRSVSWTLLVDLSSNTFTGVVVVVSVTPL